MRLKRRRIYTISGSFGMDSFLIGFGENKFAIVCEKTLKEMSKTWNLQKGFRWSGFKPDWAKERGAA
jgi:hypothetical protein